MIHHMLFSLGVAMATININKRIVDVIGEKINNNNKKKKQKNVMKINNREKKK